MIIRCSCCKLEKEETEFSRDKTKKTGCDSRCKDCRRDKKNAYMRMYCQTEEYKHRRKLQYAKNKEKELLKMKERRRTHGHIWNANRRNNHKKNPLSNMIRCAKSRAKQKGLEFDLSLGDINLPEKCPILDIPLKVSEKTVSDFSPTIDRIDNSKGYVKDNVIVISFRANTIKNNSTIEELKKIIHYYEGKQ